MPVQPEAPVSLTSRCSGPRLALLASAANRGCYAAAAENMVP